MKTPDLVAELVHQFSDPLAFYRELIQNSIDAGSVRIEVTLRYQPGSPGVATITVADWGEGMNREVIEKFLLTKFRSSKEGDLTKIGKFGIGFMSVLAPKPELVVVDTGRDGEDWRVLLLPDRSYELRRCPEPVDGTRVTLHKELTPDAYSELVVQSKLAVARWCRHSEADVTFAAGHARGGEPPAPVAVREPFTVDAPFTVEHVEEGTRIVAGPARDGKAWHGFYNRGLTLREGGEEVLVPRVAFKIVSRYLEHTLTRDNVRRDRHFDRAIELVRELVSGPLRARLCAELAGDTLSPPDRASCLRYGAGLLDADELFFPLLGGGRIDARKLARAARSRGAVLIGAAADPVAAAVAREAPVLPEEPALTPWLAAELVKRPTRRAAEQFTLVVADEAPELAAQLAALLEAIGARTRGAAVATVHGAGRERLWITVAALGAPAPAAEPVSPWKDARGVLVVNLAHPHGAAARALAARDVRLAALLLARQIAVGAEALDEARDRKLTGEGLA